MWQINKICILEKTKGSWATKFQTYNNRFRKGWSRFFNYEVMKCVVHVHNLCCLFFKNCDLEMATLIFKSCVLEENRWDSILWLCDCQVKQQEWRDGVRAPASRLAAASCRDVLFQNHLWCSLATMVLCFVSPRSSFQNLTTLATSCRPANI